ncbi:Lanthionine synthetase C-like protein [Chitinophaga sp. YR573]|uniref:class III lanthionine synthetase LanKC N-terminal domain-containing protein n=1 Tax=Chitinophaga sp. YR573 TaxID=1881040 RepID=UPI0008C345A6|nr:lanthionine synthetase LanC family protein [Chitinophaga sp. YR573]SEW04655.1 Lanthionine synthetase C-like protein [Chitinophaga sp. YR573]
MLEQNINTSIPSVVKHPKNNYQNFDDYSKILDTYGLQYNVADYYLQVGEITQVQGWIIHISVVISQVSDLLQAIVPFLIAENISFKAAKNREACLNLLNGVLGIRQVGKVISIYPENNVIALHIARELILLTKSFKGPQILTDVYLGSIIYARYGSFNPIMQNDDEGKRNKFIYDASGHLIKDPYSIPFVLPQGITWPFTSLTNPIVPIPKKVFAHFYKPLSVLKDDVRGNVYSGIYVKGLFRTAPCVIKEGKKHMVSDDIGRDIRDRLLWQQYLQNELAEDIPMPKIIDSFEEDDNTYLVMEFIKGTSLEDRLKQFTFNRISWKYLTNEEHIILISYLLQIISIIEKLHYKGYIHRDIQPANFIIDDNGQFFLIDMELTYSLKEGVPNPPFPLGTPGYMSPEQQKEYLPTVKEDIYGLGALMLCILTGLSPAKFDTQDIIILEEHINFFVGDRTISDLVSACFNHAPEERPTLGFIKSVIEQCQINLSTKKDGTDTLQVQVLSTHTLEETILNSIKGLIISPTVISEGMWCSKLSTTENAGSSSQREYTKVIGLREGIGGVLYLLAKAKRLGFDIDSCIDSYYKGWHYIEENSLGILASISPGLHDGAAGVAIALQEAIQSDLLEDNDLNRYRIQSYLQIPNNNLNIADGIAGQGIAALICKTYLDTNVIRQLLESYLTVLLNSQQKDGSWILNNSSKKSASTLIGFSYGVSGIAFFLLQYISVYPNEVVKNAAIRALNWLIKKTNGLNDLFNRKKYKKIIGEKYKTGSEWTGVILTFIRAYEIIQDVQYKKISEAALSNFHAYMINNNLTQDVGIAGIGELYLEAWYVFKNEEWKQRADWLTNLLIHTRMIENKNACYWQLQEHNRPTADLLVGTSGIIHFLLKNWAPYRLGHCILS